MSDSNSQRPGEASAASGRSGPNVSLIVGGLLLAAVIVFVLRNDNEAKIDFMVDTWTTTVRWSLFIALVLGVLLDRIFTIWWRRRKKKTDD